jgi:hypothetical protein
MQARPLYVYIGDDDPRTPRWSAAGQRGELLVDAQPARPCSWHAAHRCFRTSATGRPGCWRCHTSGMDGSSRASPCSHPTHSISGVGILECRICCNSCMRPRISSEVSVSHVLGAQVGSRRQRSGSSGPTSCPVHQCRVAVNCAALYGAGRGCLFGYPDTCASHRLPRGDLRDDRQAVPAGAGVHAHGLAVDGASAVGPRGASAHPSFFSLSK